MKALPPVLLLVFSLLLASTGLAQETSTAFIGATVIPMDRERTLPDQTVLVSNGRITAIGPRTEVEVPAGARRIDARGRFLMPGFADMHTHPQLAGDLVSYLAAGVTTIAHMGGNARTWVARRDSVRAGRLIGPDVLVSVFLNRDATGPQTADEARQAVARGDSLGVDFVKVYNLLTNEQFEAIIDEAGARHLPVLGHAVRAVGLERGFALGQAAVVHAEEYLYSTFGNSTDRSRFDDAVAFTKRSGAWVIPNLSAYAVIARQWGRPAVVDTMLAEPDALFLPPFWRERWRTSDYTRRAGSISDRVPFLSAFTGALYRGGVPLLLGTDSPGIPGMAPGPSLHDDLRLMVAAGLTPYDALAAGTSAAGEFVRSRFRHPETFGTVTVGARADLVLLARNPLENVSNAEHPVGVMARGRWYTREALELVLERTTRNGRSAAFEIARILDTEGAPAAAAYHRMLRRDSSTAFIFMEDEINQLGDELLARGDAAGARAILELNVEDYPRSANGHDSFADAALAMQDSVAAARAYRRVLALLSNPRNREENRKVLEKNAREFLSTWRGAAR